MKCTLSLVQILSGILTNKLCKYQLKMKKIVSVCWRNPRKAFRLCTTSQGLLKVFPRPTCLYVPAPHPVYLEAESRIFTVYPINPIMRLQKIYTDLICLIIINMLSFMTFIVSCLEYDFELIP